MHNVKRTKRTPAEAKKKREETLKRVKEYSSAACLLLQMKQQKDFSREAFNQTSKVLKLNTDFFTGWNYRREILLRLYGHEAELEHRRKERQGGGKAVVVAQTEREITEAEILKMTEEEVSELQAELKFNMLAIQRNPKSYWVWNYRIWLCMRLHSHASYYRSKASSPPPPSSTPATDSSSSSSQDKPASCSDASPSSATDLAPSPSSTTSNSFTYEGEIALSSKFLNLDGRNFHCWNYRRHCIAKAGGDPKQELEFTMKLIEKNFSNYSAWHQRSLLLPLLYSSTALKDALIRELELVQNAFYTEPSDQSAWLYHRWLLSYLDEAKVVDDELAKVNELLELEPDSKWCLLTYVLLLLKKVSRKQDEESADDKSRDDIIEKYLTQLATSVDVDHRIFYEELRQGSISFAL